jgi:sulfofructose kinase
LTDVRFDVVCVGAATLDFVAAVERMPGADERVPALEVRHGGGGPAATAAVTLARLGFRAAIVAAIGDDPTAAAIREGLADEGVDIRDLRLVVGARSASSVVTVDVRAGTRAIAAYRGTCGPPVVTPAVLARLRAAQWVHADHIGYEVLPEELLRGGGFRLSVDAGKVIPGLRLERVALFAPSEPVMRATYPGLSLPEAMDRALGEGAERVVVTRGPDGSCGTTLTERVVAEPFPVDAYSTLGAGDVFHGALLATLIEGRSLRDALLAANAAAALSCRSLDARGAIPTRTELEQAVGSTSTSAEPRRSVPYAR